MVQMSREIFWGCYLCDPLQQALSQIWGFQSSLFLSFLSLYTVYLGINHALHTVEMERWGAFVAGSIILLTAQTLGSIYFNVINGSSSLNNQSDNPIPGFISSLQDYLYWISLSLLVFGGLMLFFRRPAFAIGAIVGAAVIYAGPHLVHGLLNSIK
ncbi:hypothetical protein A946_10045 [Methylacidiphilum kamchatkense Kam1]|uniref:Uncharacterized protein n=2 Tax=Methylacidiphilum kamchatkense Kam1 TaxID=1202785 RepID=A0ABR4ZW52_9BACT|nr:hypothetical protein A946_10045 [Methylacidiphilum kamchatkense Kam1]